MGEPTKTPRTDSEAFWIGRGERQVQYQGAEYVRAAVARSIESELADARAALREMKSWCRECHGSDDYFDCDVCKPARSVLAKQG